MADDSTNSAHGCDKVPTVPSCTNLITAQSSKKRHTSRNTPAGTQCCHRCQSKPAKYQTRQIFMRCQLWKPVFLPRPGRRPPEMPVFTPPPRTAAEPRTRTEKQQRGEDTVNEQGDAEKRSTTTTRPASSTEDHAVPNPRRNGRREQPAGRQCHRR